VAWARHRALYKELANRSRWLATVLGYPVHQGSAHRHHDSRRQVLGWQPDIGLVVGRLDSEPDLDRVIDCLVAAVRSARETDLERAIAVGAHLSVKDAKRGAGDAFDPGRHGAQSCKGRRRSTRQPRPHGAGDWWWPVCARAYGGRRCRTWSGVMISPVSDTKPNTSIVEHAPRARSRSQSTSAEISVSCLASMGQTRWRPVGVD
jgi:hypothetical protein